MILLDGKIIADEIAGKLARRVAKLKAAGVTPRLLIITIEPQERSMIYIRMKQRRAEQIGIIVERADLSHGDQTSYEARIRELCCEGDIHGAILQLPIPESLDRQTLIDCIPPEKDIDGLTSANQSAFESGTPHFWPATPRGVLRLLKGYNIGVHDKTVTVIGRSPLVGGPLAHLLRRRGAKVLVGHRDVPDLAALTFQSDIVIAAAGNPGLVTGKMIRRGAAVVDVGTTEQDGKLAGDVDFNSVSKKAAYLSPVPGGVGPMTVIMLMQNVVVAARRVAASADAKPQ